MNRHPMPLSGLDHPESMRAPSNCHRPGLGHMVAASPSGEVWMDAWGRSCEDPQLGKVRGKGKGQDRNFGGVASNSKGWLGGARGERHPQRGETRHCTYGTRCKYAYCPFVHVADGKGQASLVKVENYWSPLQRRERSSLRPKVESRDAQSGVAPRAGNPSPNPAQPPREGWEGEGPEGDLSCPAIASFRDTGQPANLAANGVIRLSHSPGAHKTDKRFNPPPTGWNGPASASLDVCLFGQHSRFWA